MKMSPGAEATQVLASLQASQVAKAGAGSAGRGSPLQAAGVTGPGSIAAPLRGVHRTLGLPRSAPPDRSSLSAAASPPHSYPDFLLWKGHQFSHCVVLHCRQDTTRPLWPDGEVAQVQGGWAPRPPGPTAVFSAGRSPAGPDGVKARPARQALRGSDMEVRTVSHLEITPLPSPGPSSPGPVPKAPSGEGQRGGAAGEG